MVDGDDEAFGTARARHELDTVDRRHQGTRHGGLRDHPTGKAALPLLIENGAKVGDAASSNLSSQEGGLPRKPTLIAAETPRSYSPERHRAWLARKALQG